MSLYEVAVVGAGAVGEEMIRVLAEHKFPAKSIKVLARSKRIIKVDGKDYDVYQTTPEAFDGVDIALFAGTEGEKGAAVTFGAEAVRRGAVVIDNGADFRMKADVPLVVPEVNGETLRNHKGIIANPNCSTAQLMMALKPLHDFGKLTRVIVSTYQAVSGAGSAGVKDLGGFDDLGYTSEEMKLVHETHKILGDDTIAVTPVVTARVPVAFGHSEAVYVETERPISPEQARDLWEAFPGVEVVDDIRGSDPSKAYPTPLACAKSDITYIGRIRKDICNPNALCFWVVSDNLRKGAASNAVQIAEKLIELGLIAK
jgi:aspartate-semialdehyde dehydrogenase